ncbi:MAG TPA: hypothetical protein VJC17_04365 [Candidatus Dojkabacteria bacterium]|nr:hypothetical protein [Candidatus Dojkabacteria bacterium]
MKIVTLTDLKTNGSNAIPENEVSYLIVNSQPRSALVPVDLYESYIEAMEELEDLKATLQRLEEEDIPAKKVFAKLLGSKA